MLVVKLDGIHNKVLKAPSMDRRIVAGLLAYT
jgi:hypothetical protein